MYKKYTQLTQEERYQISKLCKETFPKAEIARKLMHHPGTIKRELRRYTAKKATKLTYKTIELVNLLKFNFPVKINSGTIMVLLLVLKTNIFACKMS